jgi:ABC-2 type transport system permease protein
MAPLAVLLLRQAGEGNALLMPGSAAALSLVAGQVAASIAWITISAEDAPDLLACAPAPVSLVRRGKLAAAGLPVAVLLAPLLLPLTVLTPWVGLMATLGCAAAVGAATLINVWWQKPAKRSDYRSRRGSSWFVTVAELVIGALIAVATGLLAAGVVWGLVPAVLAGLVFLGLRRSDARIAEALRAAS